MFSIHLCAEAACAKEQHRPACASAMRSRKKKKNGTDPERAVGSGAGGAGSGGPGAPPSPSRDPYLGALGSTEAVARTGSLFRQMKNTPFRSNCRKINFQVSFCGRMSNKIKREGKLERKNLRFAVNVHLKRLSGLEAYT